MNIEKFLQFIMSHNATIIEVLLGLTLLVIIFLSIRIFLVEKSPESGSASSGTSLDMGQLEKTLKEILEKAGQVPSTAVSGSSEDSQKLTVEITQLKSDLQAKQKQIEELKTSSSAGAASASNGLSDADKEKLEAQLKELQAKLSEYEIISEDIADLSFYKEQNAKLQKEMEALKASGPAAAAAAVAPVAPAPTVAPSGPASIAAEEASAAPPAFEIAMAAEKAEPEIVGIAVATEAAFQEEPTFGNLAEAPASSDADTSVDDQLMAEFAAAVEKQKTTTETSTPVTAVAPTAPAVAAAPEVEASVDLGQMDMDKMLAEAAVIKADGPDVDAEQALGVAVDENKLLQEAAALDGVSSEEKLLMGEFENFVKKNES